MFGLSGLHSVAQNQFAQPVLYIEAIELSALDICVALILTASSDLVSDGIGRALVIALAMTDKHRERRADLILGI